MPSLEASPIFGRQNEVEALYSVLERTVLGEAAHAVLIGEPGIGKTRLVSEAINRAQEFSGLTSCWPRMFTARNRPSLL